MRVPARRWIACGVASWLWAAPLAAQQPATAPPPPPPAQRPEPEEEAARDLEEMSRGDVEKKALEGLRRAADRYGEACQEMGAGRKLPFGHWAYEEDENIASQARYAVRYFAKVFGLPTDPDELQDLDAISHAVPEELKTPGVPRNLALRFPLPGLNTWWTLRTCLEAIRLFRVGAQENPRPAPKPVSANIPSVPDSGDTGRSKGTKIAIGAGAGVVLVGVVAAGGGSDSTPSAAPTPAPLTPFNPAGIYDVTMTLRTDPGGNAPRIGMEPSLPLNFIVTGSTLRFTCPPGVHINPGEGPVDLTTGSFNITGSGPFAGRNGVLFLFPGTFGRDGTVTGEYRVGTAGELGEVTTYAVNGRKRQ